MVASTACSLGSGSRGVGWNNWDQTPRQAPRRYPNFEVQRVRRQGPKPGPFRKSGPNAPVNRRLVPVAPAPEQDQVRIRPQRPAAQKRILKEYQPENRVPEQFAEDVDRYNFAPAPEPVYRKQAPAPVRQERPVSPVSRYSANDRVDIDSDISESIAVPHEQHDLEAAVHAGAAGYRGVSNTG